MYDEWWQYNTVWYMESNDNIYILQQCDSDISSDEWAHRDTILS